jgi:site-specific recombinase XerD
MVIEPLSRVRVTGPLEPFAVGFAGELSVQGYRGQGIGHQLRLVAHLSGWLAEENLEVASLTGATVGRFLVARRAAGYKQWLSQRALEPLLVYLRALGQAPLPSVPRPEGPVEELLCRFRDYLIVERGLAAPSARRYAEAVRPFLASRLTPEGLDLEGLDAAALTAFVLAECAKKERGSAKQTVSRLRSLVSFLYLEGMIDRSLTAALPTIAAWRLASLPKAISSAQVQGILGSCDRRTATGRRDFAILITLVRLGLRRGEVARLLLEDIDWHAGQVVVFGKGARSDRLPLPADVGEAIAAYLRRGRPDTAQDRSVFVRLRAPHRALTPGAVGQIVLRACERAGLAPVHAHRLRHTAACQMLGAGASLQEVGQVLRHRRIETTAIYAKVDRQALGRIARPWPGGLA